jgi:hypothetical protein
MLPHVNWLSRHYRALRTLGPYAVVELVVPGGSLIVLSLWAIRHRAWLAAYARRAFARTNLRTDKPSRGQTLAPCHQALDHPGRRGRHC